MHHRGVADEAGEGGFALIEILVSVVILGISFAAILGGMLTSINTSDLHRQQAQVEAVLDGAVERVKAPEVARVVCATSANWGTYLSAAQAAATAQGWAASTVSITSVKYWDGTGYVASPCNDDATHKLTLQEITLQVIHPNNRSTQSLTFIKGVG